jgi:TonB family protein
MNKSCFELALNRLVRAGIRLMQAAALTLMMTLTMPARAADARAIKSRVPPSYPEIAKRMKIFGVVRLAVTVDPEGKVTEVKPLSGNGTLSAAAEEAVHKWKFESGASVSTVEVSVNFAP